MVYTFLYPDTEEIKILIHILPAFMGNGKQVGKLYFIDTNK